MSIKSRLEEVYAIRISQLINENGHKFKYLKSATNVSDKKYGAIIICQGHGQSSLDNTLDGL